MNTITNPTNEFLEDVTAWLQFDSLGIKAVELLGVLRTGVFVLREFAFTPPRPRRLPSVAFHARGVGLELSHLPARELRAVFPG